MQLGAHSPAQRLINALMLLDPAVRGNFRHHARFIMVAVSGRSMISTRASGIPS